MTTKAEMKYAGLPGALSDYLLTRFSTATSRRLPPTGRMLETAAGRLYLLDSDAGNNEKPCVVFTPDGPNVVAHYTRLMALLTPRLRVIVFDMPGFGFSLPTAGYGHSLQEGAQVVLDLLSQLHIPRATLAFSCANGLYAIRAAQLQPQRIASLMLTQTPSLPHMQAWAYRMIPLPLRVPVAGQLITWAARRTLATRWYRSALPTHADMGSFTQTTAQSFKQGGCFWLAWYKACCVKAACRCERRSSRQCQCR
ncbi:alpha/beta hydrolase [Herbaspirillum lusitanum]|uniref:Alpha/beta hydrolase n=1 Tax=Herbaspirillum lusitanum TaxID=213312 RepID=A0ABW9A5V7_9BURK